MPQSVNMVGTDALRQLLLKNETQHSISDNPMAEVLPKLPTLSSLVEEIAADQHGLVMLMGKWRR